ncbi:importin subunit alpha-3-like [Drosophila subpulchrella]|uniref:importin subunit alpha-3-like n=1 Tax=Drosophila subpulchrella TaxID=1486046 RepID=UPI0018A1A2F4|nr:importin subunit alpha-3-like [Drosophila subpulchrella]
MKTDSSINQDEVKQVVQSVIDATNPELQLTAVQDLNTVLSLENPPIDEVIQSGILPILVNYLKESSHVNLQAEAAWALTNLTSGNSEQTIKVVAAGTVPFFLEFLKSENLNVYEPALWALGNIIGDGPLLRDFVIRMGVVQPLVSFTQRDVPSPMLYNVALVIGNLCRYYSSSSIATISTENVLQILPALEVLISNENLDILNSALWAIAFLAGGGKEHIQMVIESGMLPKLISFMGHMEVKVQTPALRAVGNILKGTDEQCQVVLNHDPFSHYPSESFCYNKNILKEEFRFLWSVTSCNHVWVQAIIDVGLLSKIIEMLNVDGSLDYVAATAISNLTKHCTEDQMITLVRKGVLKPFCDVLTGKLEETTKTVLSGLSNMLKMAHSHADELAKSIYDCGGLAKIEELQTHENVEIYQAAQQIIELYFGDDS